jgi:4a-hydroxytetrahydrobiopterin dehydratase
MKLHEKKCIPCSGQIPPLGLEEVNKFMRHIDSSWDLRSKEMQLWRTLSFKDFKTPLKLLNEISGIAEEQWHHPELILGFGKLEIGIWTHKINGLVESDFIFAAKIDQLIIQRDRC